MSTKLGSVAAMCAQVPTTLVPDLHWQKHPKYNSLHPRSSSVSLLEHNRFKHLLEMAQTRRRSSPIFGFCEFGTRLAMYFHYFILPLAASTIQLILVVSLDELQCSTSCFFILFFKILTFRFYIYFPSLCKKFNESRTPLSTIITSSTFNQLCIVSALFDSAWMIIFASLFLLPHTLTNGPNTLT